MRLLGGSRACFQENFFKRCNLVSFGVYFDMILPKKITKLFTLYTKIIIYFSHVMMIFHYILVGDTAHALHKKMTKN